MSTEVRLPVTDLAEPIMFSNPFPRYAELRSTAPVSMVKHRETRQMTSYMLTRYADVMTLCTDPRFSSDALRHSRGRRLVARRLPRMFRLLTDSMVFKDDPEHKRLRGLVNKAFTPKRVQEMTDDVQAIVDRLVADLATKPGEVDLVADLAVPLPLEVIASMLGVADADRERFRATLERFSGGNGGSVGEALRMIPAGRQLVRMFDRMAEERRSEPDDGLISALVSVTEGTDALSPDEIVAMIFLLLLAGHDTTSNLIGSSVVALLDDPMQLERLRADPTVAESAVEELLRFTTPVPAGVSRTLLDDIELSGTLLPKGSTVLGMIISANRDERVFDDPDTLDLGRQPNRHLTFAFGSHYCLGNQLARLEGRLALQALTDRFEHIELAVPRDQLRWKPTQTLRGLRSLPLRLR